jgi:hypothetical protein
VKGGETVTEKKISTQIPVIFQKLEEFEKEDSRFLKVKIWLMHTGLNFNGSSFSKEAVDKAIPTLANTPILSFIEENSEGEQDFSDHRMVLHRSEDGDYNFKYLGSAVGVIPEVNNAHWEMRVTDSGEEKEYLVVDALMWTKWGDPTDIMAAKGQTSQSMELSDQYSGSFDKDGVFHFETFSFFGACLLGDGVLPAMQNSTVEVQFTENNAIQKSIENKLQEFYTLFSQQGGTGMEKETVITKVEENFEATPVVETEVEVVVVEEQLETPAEVVTVEVEETFEVATETVVVDEVVVVEETQQTEPAQEFALTASQLVNQIRSELGKEHYHDSWGDQCRKYWYVDHTDAIAIFENCQDSYQLYAAPYTLNGDNVELNLAEAYKVKVEFVPFEGEASAFTANVERFSVEQATLQSQLTDLQSYKRTREEEDLQAKFADKLSTEEFTQVFDSMKESELDKVEEKLFALIGKKNFSISKPATQVNKVSFSLPKEEDSTPNPFGDIFED